MKKVLISMYEKAYEFRRLLVLRTKYRLRIMPPKKTLKYILKKRCSIARYGDGEFNHIFNVRDEGYQIRSPELAKKLAEVLKKGNDNLLLCVPYCLNNLTECTPKAKKFWIEWGRDNNHQIDVVNMIRSFSGENYLFGDSQITRPYIDWKSNKRAKKTFPLLKQLWENRNLIIVEGEKTRLGVGNDLFEGASSIKRILAPAEGAFDFCDEIEDKIKELCQNELVLLALGPTATIIAADLSEVGIQALDLGHIDIEYEWYLMGAKEKVVVDGKYTNEAKVEQNILPCDDKQYLNQIVARIGC